MSASVLALPCTTMRPGVDAGAQGGRELAGARDVGAQTALAEQPQHADRAAGLAGERDVRVGVCRRRRRRRPARARAASRRRRRRAACRSAARAPRRPPRRSRGRRRGRRRRRPRRAERRHARAQARVAAIRHVSAASCSSTRAGDVPPGALRARHGLLGRRLGEALAGRDARRDAARAPRGTACRRARAPRRRRWPPSAPSAAAARMRSASKCRPADEQRSRAQRALEGRHLRERELLVLLEVAVVGQRQALADGEHGREPADRDAGAAAQVLGDLRVLLLRHDRRARARPCRRSARTRTPAT